MFPNLSRVKGRNLEGEKNENPYLQLKDRDVKEITEDDGKNVKA